MIRIFILLLCGNFCSLCANDGATQEQYINLELCNDKNNLSCIQIINYLSVACNGGGVVACGVLGYMYENGIGFDVNFKEAKAYYEDSCNGDYNLSCVNLGNMYANGNGVKKDARKANQLFNKACKNNSAEGCINLGIAYFIGNEVRLNVQKANELFNNAIEIYKESCKNNNAESCISLSLIYKDGLGDIQKDEALAIKYQNVTCSIDKNFCD